MLPEVLAERVFPPKRWKDDRNAYRVICGIGAVGNILIMMSANLVGFALGLDGLRDLVLGIVGSVTGTCNPFLFLFSLHHCSPPLHVSFGKGEGARVEIYPQFLI